MAQRNKREKSLLQVYALVSKRGDGAVYVGQCKAGNERQVYRLHIQGKYLATTHMFDAGIATRKMPDMYSLTTYEGYPQKSLTYVYAYAKYFQDYGHCIQMTGFGTDGLEDISDESRKIYETIRHIPEEEMLSEKNLLVKNYQLQGWQEKDDESIRTAMSIYTTPEGAETIRRRAEACGLSVSEYGEQMMLNGVVVKADYAELIQSVNRIYKSLYDLNDSIRHYGGMYAAHKNTLQSIESTVSDLSGRVSETTAKAMAQARNEAARAFRRTARTARKEGTT